MRPLPPWSLGVLWGLAGCAPVHRYPDGTGIEGQLEREVVALKIRIQELEAQLSRAPMAGSQGDLVPELVQVFSGSGVIVAPHGPGARLTVPVELAFAEVRELRIREKKGDMVLDLLATALAKHEQYDVHVIGHWSDRPSPIRNTSRLQLTLELARVFAERLVSHDVPEARLIVSGRGDSAPLTSNDLRVGQDANERIDIILAVPPETFE